ncbi:hypothetical protein GA0115240_11079 [Streptomyces sp. DvalAA-14]|uniref:hypothetical protein n=1 Tax=unclassified Streptomyces TaxID=2593676 RepID=UPI00081B6EEE|nr:MULTISPECIES: hypothetical protein [unclassified Streptomyces]MYS19597.1 hypothetical protein [Streptomyces sp. SID4948]SCD48421.1 hypothetical protein GA0115240_11079 [Streptomyces sp. DvalAA-14]
MTDARGVCASRAESLTADVAYVRGWAHAREAADLLAEELLALGLDSDFPGLKADVNVFGDGIVHLGPVRLAAVEILAQLIAGGLAVEAAEEERAKLGLPGAAAG